MRPREPYRRLGEDIAAAFGDFNAVHIRRGDFMTGYYKDAAMTPQAIVENLSGVMPRHAPLLICTDASTDNEFFAPILAAYPGAVMLERHVIDDPFLFVFNPLGERAPFLDGAFAETPEGVFTWNRFPYARSSESYAWFREWPEAFR